MTAGFEPRHWQAASNAASEDDPEVFRGAGMAHAALPLENVFRFDRPPDSVHTTDSEIRACPRPVRSALRPRLEGIERRLGKRAGFPDRQDSRPVNPCFQRFDRVFEHGDQQLDVSFVRRMARGQALTEPVGLLANLATPHVAALPDVTSAIAVNRERATACCAPLRLPASARIHGNCLSSAETFPLPR
jgi:hypothetical protein